MAHSIEQTVRDFTFISDANGEDDTLYGTDVYQNQTFICKIEGRDILNFVADYYEGFAVQNGKRTTPLQTLVEKYAKV